MVRFGLIIVCDKKGNTCQQYFTSKYPWDEVISDLTFNVPIILHKDVIRKCGVIKRSSVIILDEEKKIFFF